MSAETNESVLWACPGGEWAEPHPGLGRARLSAAFSSAPGAPWRLHRLGGGGGGREGGGGAPPRAEFLAAQLPCGPRRGTAAAGVLGAEACRASRAALGGYEAPEPRLRSGFGRFCGSGGEQPRRGSGGVREVSGVAPFAAAPLPPTGVRPSCPWAPASSGPGKGLATR